MEPLIEGMLDSKAIKIYRDEKGRLMLKDGERERQIYRAARSFPLTAPDQFICLFDEDDKEIGIIRDINELDESSRQLLREELEKAYFMPKIKRVLSVKEVYGGVKDFSVETDRGYRDFEIHGLNSIKILGLSRVIITDVHGNRYEIPDLRDLDPRSRSLIEWVI